MTNALNDSVSMQGVNKTASGQSRLLVGEGKNMNRKSVTETNMLHKNSAKFKLYEKITAI